MGQPHPLAFADKWPALLHNNYLPPCSVTVEYLEAEVGEATSYLERKHKLPQF